MSKLRNKVKLWYLKFFKPTQPQFHYWMDSTWFKDEKIPPSNIEGLAGLLNEKASSESLTAIEKNKLNKNARKGVKYNETDDFLEADINFLDKFYLEKERGEIDLRGLNEDTFYPVLIRIKQFPSTRIKIFRSTNTSNHGAVSYGTISGGGFSFLLEWESNAEGWGTSVVYRKIHRLESKYSTKQVAGSIGQLGKSSHEYVYLRGGSLFNYEIEGRVIELPKLYKVDSVISYESSNTLISLKNDTTISDIVVGDKISVTDENGIVKHTVYGDDKKIPFGKGLKTNARGITQIDEDYLKAEINKGYKFKNLSDVLNVKAYRYGVIAMCELTNENANFNSWSSFELVAHRVNGAIPELNCHAQISKEYNKAEPRGTLFKNILAPNIKCCTFLFGGKKYGGVHFFYENAQYNDIYINWQGNFAPFALDYKDVEGGVTILNTEVANSLAYPTNNIRQGTIQLT